MRKSINIKMIFVIALIAFVGAPVLGDQCYMTDNLINILKSLVLAARIIAVVILIVMVSMDLVNFIINPVNEKGETNKPIFKRIIRRFLLVLLLIFLGTIINLLFGVLNSIGISVSTCGII